jgi:mono/diheme cytochrome c family protein
MRATVVFGVGLGLGLAACGGGDPSGGDPDAPPAARLTWYQDIGPIVAEHCMECHQDGGIAPFSLTSYADVVELAPQLLAAVETGLMPPWDAEDAADCTPTRSWKDDPRLSTAEIDTLRAWIDDGMAEGTLAELPEPPDTTLTDVSHTLTPAEGYVTSGPSDEFMCFLLEPEFLAPVKWMTGLQVRPGNPDVVHHAVLAVMQPGAELDALKATVGVGRAYPCTNPATATGAYLLGVWTPGNQPMQTASDLAVPILRGSAVVMQIHYHPANQVNAPDATAVDLRLGDTWPEKMYTYGSWGNAFAAPDLLPGPHDRYGTAFPEFRIPADTDDHSEHMRFTVDTGELGSVPLFAAYPHMHYIGIGLQVRIERATPSAGEPAEECLVNVPRWNFDWQRAYQYDAAFADLPAVQTGDVIDVRCTYDNTLANPFVQRALEDAGLTTPIDIALGEETLDEMCLGIFGIVLDAPPQGGAVAMPVLPPGMAMQKPLP